MADFARGHHFIPVFYLAGFTDSGKRKGKIWGLDKTTGKQWPTRPENIAKKRDAYRIDLDGVPPDAIEKALGDFEGKAAHAVRQIKSDLTLPKEDGYAILVNLVALMTARVPRMRSTIADFIDRVSKKIMAEQFASKERFEALRERMRCDGINFPEETTYEDMQSLVEGGEYTVDLDQNWHVQTFLENVDTLIKLLWPRKWSLFVVEDGQGDLICSDSPVTLTSDEPAPPILGVGYGMANTEVVLPLTKKLALLARFEGEPCVQKIDRTMVARLNTRTLLYADRFLYTPDKDFIWLKAEGDVGSAPELIELLATAASSQAPPESG